MAAGVYFAPESHAAYKALGFDGSPAHQGGVDRPNMTAYFTSRGACMGAAAIAALLATALIHLLLVAAPRPLAFFGWIIGLLIIVVTVLPFTSAAELPTKLATATINLVVGIAIASLTSGTAARLARTSRRTAGGDPALG